MVRGQVGFLIVLAVPHVALGPKHGHGNAIPLHHQKAALIALVNHHRPKHVKKRNAVVCLLATYAHLHM